MTPYSLRISVNKLAVPLPRIFESVFATVVHSSGIAPFKMSGKQNLRTNFAHLAVPLPRTNYLRVSFRYSGAYIWNSISQNVGQAKSLNEFAHL